MAGLFPSIANSQNVDRNGVPLVGSVLSVFTGGTLTLANCYQDIGLALTAQNPMTADATGRLPIFYVADGVYRVRLVDQYGVSIYDYPQLASIGASSSGGGGSAVDPTTVFSTGDEIWRKVGGVKTGWVPQNARTIGSATSGASERNNSDCQPLFLFLWANYTDAKCPVVGGRGVSAAADWAANKKITLPDMRGKGPHGLDGMGNSRANVIPDANVAGGDTGDTDAASGGATTHAVEKVNLPSYNLIVAITALLLRFKGGHNNSPTLSMTGIAGANNQNNGDVNSGDSAGVNLVSGSGTAASGGSGVALETISPFALGTWYMKL